MLPAENETFGKKSQTTKLVPNKSNPVQKIYSGVYLGTSKSKQNNGCAKPENMSEHKRKLYASLGLLCNLPAKKECGNRVVCVKPLKKG